MGIPISQFIEMFGDPESVIKNAINTVADVADVQVGLVIKPTRFYSADGTGTPAFRSLNIGEMYIRDSEWVYFTDKGMVENQRTIAHTGDVLVVRSGYPGTSCVVTPEYDGRNVVDLIIAHPNVSKILPEFLCAFTNYPHGKIQIENSQRGVAQKHFNVSLYNKMKIVVPPMELQKQFVQLLHQSDKSKFACLKSQFIEMFKYINHDEYKTLDDVCILITDGTHNPPKFVESGIPFILVSNITGNIVTYETPKYITENDYRVLMKRTPIEKGDVLLSTVGSYGHPAIVTEDRPFAFQRHIAHLKPNRDLLTSEYLHAAILSSIVQEQIEILILGVAQKTLNLSAIRQIKIPVPSIEEQNVFVSFVEQSDKSKLCFHLHTTALYYTHS